MSMARHLWRGSALGVVEQGVRAAVALALTPLMALKLGAANFGLWVLMTGVFSQFALLDPGLQTSLPRFLVSADLDRRRSSASTGLALFVVVALVSAVLTLAVWLALPWFVRGADVLSAARHMAWLLGGASVVIAVTRVMVLHLQSELRRDLIAVTGVVRVLVCGALTGWLLLAHGGGLIEVAAVQSLGACVEALWLGWCGRAVLADVQRAWVRRAMARELLGYSGWAYAISVCERLRSGLDAFVLGWLRGSAAAGVYSLGWRPVSMVSDTVYSGLGSQLLPAFGKLLEHGGPAHVGDAFRLVMRLSARVATAAAVLVLALGPAFLRVWVPQHADAALPVLLCLAVPFAVQVAQVPAVHLLYALSKHRALALAQMAMLLLNVVLSVVLARRLGVVGAALGTAIEIAALHTVVAPVLMARLAHVSAAEFLLRCQALPMLASLAGMAPAAVVLLRWLSASPSIPALCFAGAALVLWCSVWLVISGGRADWIVLRGLLSPQDAALRSVR